MVVERGRTSILFNREGQSLLEFLFLVPFMLALTLLMYRVNGAIQTSIVHQQYARAQALFLTSNNSIYPGNRLRVKNLVETGFDQVVIGMSNDPIPSDTADYVPPAPTQNLAARSAPQGSDEAKAEPERRANVRVRTTVVLCTQPTTLGLENSPTTVLYPVNAENKAIGKVSIPENVRFKYCKGPAS